MVSNRILGMTGVLQIPTRVQAWEFLAGPSQDGLNYYFEIHTCVSFYSCAHKSQFSRSSHQYLQRSHQQQLRLSKNYDSQIISKSTCPEGMPKVLKLERVPFQCSPQNKIYSAMPKIQLGLGLQKINGKNIKLIDLT